MRPSITQSMLLVALLGTSLVSAEPLPSSLGALVGTWEARYKTESDNEFLDVLTIVPSGQRLSGTYEGYDGFFEYGPWYFFVRIQELTREADGTIVVTIGPRNVFDQRPKSPDQAQFGSGITNRDPDPFRLEGTLVDGVLSLACAPRSPGEDSCPLQGSTRVFHKRRN